MGKDLPELPVESGLKRVPVEGGREEERGALKDSKKEKGVRKRGVVGERHTVGTSGSHSALDTINNLILLFPSPTEGEE